MPNFLVLSPIRSGRLYLPGDTISLSDKGDIEELRGYKAIGAEILRESHDPNPGGGAGGRIPGEKGAGSATAKKAKPPDKKARNTTPEEDGD
jgi:hypothetical protein